MLKQVFLIWWNVENENPLLNNAFFFLWQCSRMTSRVTFVTRVVTRGSNFYSPKARSPERFSFTKLMIKLLNVTLIDCRNQQNSLAIRWDVDTGFMVAQDQSLWKTRGTTKTEKKRKICLVTLKVQEILNMDRLLKCWCNLYNSNIFQNKTC